MKWVLIVLCALVVVGRFLTGIDGEGGTNPKEPIHWERWYIDFSHLVVFGMLGASAGIKWARAELSEYVYHEPEWERNWNTYQRVSRWLFWTAVAMTAIEVIVAVAGRKFPWFADLLLKLNLLAPNGEGFPIF